MKLTVSLSQLNDSPENFLHHAGYGMIFDSRRNISSYVRRLGADHYPRLHLYFDLLGDKVTFNLHLDQKQASYEGSHMHSAEYDSELVGDEVNRLRGIIGIGEAPLPSFQNKTATVIVDNNSVNNQIINPDAVHGDWRSDLRSIPPVKKSWWQKIFS